MVNFQQEKKLILDFFNDLDSAKSEDLVNIIFKYTSDNFYMRCTHPFNEIKGAENVAKHLWKPIKNSFRPIQRRMDIFYAYLEMFPRTSLIRHNTHIFYFSNHLKH